MGIIQVLGLVKLWAVLRFTQTDKDLAAFYDRLVSIWKAK